MGVSARDNLAADVALIRGNHALRTYRRIHKSEHQPGTMPGGNSGKLGAAAGSLTGLG